MTACRVALVDDHHLVRAGLSALVESLPDFDVAFSTDDPKDLQARLLSQEVELLLLDISLRGTSGIQVLEGLRKDFPDLPVIMLSMHKEREYVLHALQAGASGYLLKDALEGELELALRSVLAGNSYLSPQVSAEVVNALLHAGESVAREPAASALTPRQLQILIRLAMGERTKEIAYALEISVKTVETYRAQIMERLGIHSLAGLVRYAIREGLISSD